jgi:hypothetical protein
MTPESVSKCQICDKPATSMCGGCQSATYSHYYCSKVCQKQDWPNHKIFCSDLKVERVLIRASTILQAAYLKFRENTWNMPIVKIEDCGGGELIIHRGSDNDKDYFLPFPAHLMKTTAIKNQVLCTSMCSESIAWMHETIAGLLSGNIHPPSLPTSSTLPNKHSRPQHHHRRTHHHPLLRPALHHHLPPHQPPPHKLPHYLPRPSTHNFHRNRHTMGHRPRQRSVRHRPTPLALGRVQGRTHHAHRQDISVWYAQRAHAPPSRGVRLGLRACGRGNCTHG